MNSTPSRLDKLGSNYSAVIIYTLCILVYVTYRAYRLSFTFDEIVSYDLLQGLSLDTVGKSANYHLLNSLLMKACNGLFGSSELSLRLPNVLAFVLYAIASIRIGSLIEKHYRLHIVILLTSMPFVLDFFSLARGYGLGIGFVLLSLTFLLHFVNDRRFLQALLSLFCAMLGVLANYTTLNYFLPALFVLILIILLDSKKFKLLFAAILILLAGGFLSALWPILMELKNGGQLFFGGKTGLFYDTVGSLGRCFGYFKPFTPVAEIIFVILFSISIIVAITFTFLFIKNRAGEFIHYLSILFLLSLLSPVAQHVVFDTSFPAERTAIMYYPLMILVLFYGVNARPWKKAALFNNALVLFFFIHFLYTLNLTHCYSWRFESGTKNAIVYLKENFKEVKLGTDYIHKMSAEYYKRKEQFDGLWVKQVTECWQYPLGLEELDPYYYNAESTCNESMSYDIRKALSSEVEFYYLDKFIIDEFIRSSIHFEILQEYPYSRSFLIRLPPTSGN